LYINPEGDGVTYISGNVTIDGTVYADAFSSNISLSLQTGGTTKLYISDSSGYVGIGTTTPTAELDVNGNGRFRSIGSGAYSSALNITSDGTLTTSTSDARLKKNVETIDNALSKVMQLRGVTFNWTDPSEPKRMIGMVAQEVIEVMPELVYQNPTDGYYGINYGETAGLLIEAIKEQQSQIEELKAQILGEAEVAESTESSSSTDTELLSSMQALFEEFKSFVATLGMTTQTDEFGNDFLVIDSDVNVLGDVSLTNLNVMGNVQAGAITVDTIENSIDILGVPCYNEETNTKNSDLCIDQTLYLQKSGSGNLNIFDGKLVIEPDGTMKLDGSLEVTGTVTAQDVKTTQVVIDSTEVASASAGKVTINAGETSVQVQTTAATENAVIMVTPERPVAIGSKFIEPGLFEITLKEDEIEDLQVSWFIVGSASAD